MPIRPEMRPLYPPREAWRAIRRAILERAGGLCECVGGCGYSHPRGGCRAPDGDLVDRRMTALPTPGAVLEEVRPHVHDGTCLGERCSGVRVVLTIAHLDHDPSNNDPANLRALCQRCHLRLDKHEHARNAAETRARRRDEAAGQARLPLSPVPARRP